jgi:hypothetical protein
MRTSFRNRPPFVAVLAICALAAVPVAARAETASAGTGVARISVVQGQVALRRGDSSSSTAAVVNAPVLGADYVTTAPGARGEVELDAATSVRLGENVQMRFSRIDAGDRAFQLAEGTVEVRLLRTTDARTEIDTPSVAVRPRSAGSYRITVDGEGRTLLSVRTGLADVFTPQGTEIVQAGTSLLATGPASGPTLERVAAIALDDFDRFNDERDARELRALSDAYAPPGIAGAEDLAAYGRWTNDASYGTVWVPYAVAPGWAPYRTGRWTWADHYGWTWIGAEPWGWAPYHYGRWFHDGRNGWCWVPARSVVPWSPALVTFLTFGGGPGLGFDTIGWLPLAPFEPFAPWWGAGGTTIVNVTNVYPYAPHRWQHPHWANLAHGGATGIPKRRFLEGRFEGAVALAPSRMRSAAYLRGPVPLVPTEANLRFSERPVAASLAAAPAFAQRRFAGGTAVAHRTPIEQQRAAIPAAPNVAPRPVAPRDPWARFGTARRDPAVRQDTASHPVTVITGTTTASGTPAATTVTTKSATGADAWTRFDAASRNRPASPAQAQPAPQRHYEAPRSNDVPRTYEAPRPPAPAYVAPPHHEPAPAAQAPAHTSPSHGEQHGGQSGTPHHQH